MALLNTHLGHPDFMLSLAEAPTARRRGPVRARWHARVRRFIVLLMGAGAVVGVRPTSSMAETLRVCATSCIYSDYTSIQAAIDAARTGDRILIAPGTYTETLAILPPVAAKTLTLIGSGASKTIVDGGQQNCVLEVETDYTVNITGLTLTNGKCLAAGGILNHGKLTLSNVSVSHNEGEETAGGIANDIDGSLTLISSTVNDNISTDQTAGRGGGIFNLGTASLINTTVSGNSAPVAGGGIENFGQLQINNSPISNNTTQGLGGGIESHNGGAGTASVTLSNSPVTYNTAFTGGGLFNNSLLTLTGSQISNNAAGEGGGLENSARGTATLTNCPVSRNTASVDGGGVVNDRGTLTMTDSPVSGNKAISTSGAKGGGLGVFGGTAQLNRSPVTQNTVSGPIGGLGGGIVITDDGNLTLSSSPVVGNTASTDGGGIYNFTGSVIFQMSWVLYNQPDNCVNVPGC